MQSKSLKNRVAIITGGRRIGQAVALSLAKLGIHVVMTYRTKPGELSKLQKTCQKYGVSFILIAADATKEAEVKRVIKTVQKKFKRLDILINMASTFERRPFNQLDKKQWDADLAANLTSAFLFAKAAIPPMRQNRWGRIINFTDRTAATHQPGYTVNGYLAYYVAKGAVNSLTEVLALQEAKWGITVNAIAPGPILPPPDMSAQERRTVAKTTPLGRWGGVEQMAKAVEYFILPDSFTTGVTLTIDGGRHLI